MPEKNLLQLVHLFAGLDQDELNALQAKMARQTHTEDEIIVQQNTIGSQIYIIAEGSVEVFIQDQVSAKEQVLVILGRGQVFGEMALLDQGYRSASVRVSQDGCKVFVLEYDGFMELVQEKQNIGFRVMRNLASDLAFKLRHRNLAQM